MNMRVKACESVRVCLSTRGKLARERFNKRVIAKNSVRRAKTQDELRLAKKKKKCTRDKKSFVSCVLNKNRERIGLLLRQDGVLLRNGGEKVELAHPLLLCHSAKVFKSPLQAVSFSPDMGSIHPPSPRRGKDGAIVQGMRIPRLGILGPAGHRQSRASCFRPLGGRHSEAGREQKPRNASTLPGWQADEGGPQRLSPRSLVPFPGKIPQGRTNRRS